MTGALKQFIMIVAYYSIINNAIDTMIIVILGNKHIFKCFIARLMKSDWRIILEE